MKKNFIILCLFFIVITTSSQTPQKISYQAVVRNSNNILVSNTNIGMQVCILQGSGTGTAVYKELHFPTTNVNGLVTIEIGTGTVVTGVFSSINWAVGPFYIKTEIDLLGGSNYTITGITQVLSVPYALHSKTAEGLTGTYPETDSVFKASQASKITVTDITNLGNLTANLNNKVDKITGKDLSTNDYTTSDKTKLNEISEGAEVNVNADWNATNGDAQILNKPTTISGYGITDAVTISNNQTILDSKVFNKDIIVNGITIGTGNNTTGYNGTAIGSYALKSNISGNDNVAVGFKSLYFNTTGYENVANGSGTMYSNTTGADNTANGTCALYNNTGGSNNTANGYYTLSRNITGYNNTANGSNALLSNTTGYYNSSNGSYSLYSNSTGMRNTASGFNALYTNTTGNYNTAIGCNADVSVNNLTNTTAIGYNAKVNTSNQIVLGNSNVTVVGSYGAWTNYSDKRLKENIIYKNDLGLNFICLLKPASYNYISDINKKRRDGLIAQDVQQILKDLNVEFSGLIVEDDKNKTLNLSYSEFVIPLINAVKEQQNEIKTLELRIEQLERLLTKK